MEFDDILPSFEQILRLAPIATICAVLMAAGWYSARPHIKDLREIIDRLMREK